MRAGRGATAGCASAGMARVITPADTPAIRPERRARLSMPAETAGFVLQHKQVLKIRFARGLPTITSSRSFCFTVQNLSLANIMIGGDPPVALSLCEHFGQSLLRVKRRDVPNYDMTSVVHFGISGCKSGDRSRSIVFATGSPGNVSNISRKHFTASSNAPCSK